MPTATYDELWRRLGSSRTVSPAAGRRDARRRTVEVVVRVNDPALFRRLDRIRAALSALPFVAAVPDHSLHLPLLELGGYTDRAARATDWRRDELASVGEALRARAASLRGFSLTVARVNAAVGEVFAEIQPGDSVLELRAGLADLARVHADEGFLPRFPLAFVTSAGNAAALARAMDWFRDRPIGVVPVMALTLAVAHRWTRVPTVQRIAEVPLGS